MPLVAMLTVLSNPSILDFLGPGRYLQLAICKAYAQNYSERFGAKTSKRLSNEAASEGNLSFLFWCKKIGCNWDGSLFESAAEQDSVQILLWLAYNKCPKPTNSHACEIAAGLDNRDVLFWLIRFGCDGGLGMCTAASAGGHLDLIQELDDLGCSFDAEEMCLAAGEHSHYHILDWVLDEGFLTLEDQLDIAARNGDCETVRFLLDNGADIRDATLDGEPLIFSVTHPEVLRILVDAWMNTEDAATPDDENPVINRAADNCCLELVKALTHTSHGTDVILALNTAVEYGNCEIVEFLISAGVDIDGANDLGQTALHRAIYYNHTEMVKILVGAPRINLEAETMEGQTPLWFAAESGDLDSLLLLINAGADLNKIDGFGTSPLHAAVFNNEIEIVEALLRAGADYSIKDVHGRTALDIAREERFNRIVNAITAAGDNGITGIMADESIQSRSIGKEMRRSKRRRKHHSHAVVKQFWEKEECALLQLGVHELIKCASTCKRWRESIDRNATAWTTAMWELDPTAVLGPKGAKEAVARFEEQKGSNDGVDAHLWLHLAKCLCSRQCAGDDGICNNRAFYMDTFTLERFCSECEYVACELLINDFMFNKNPSIQVATSGELIVAMQLLDEGDCIEVTEELHFSADDAMRLVNYATASSPYYWRYRILGKNGRAGIELWNATLHFSCCILQGLDITVGCDDDNIFPAIEVNYDCRVMLKDCSISSENDTALMVNNGGALAAEGCTVSSALRGIVVSDEETAWLRTVGRAARCRPVLKKRLSKASW